MNANKIPRYSSRIAICTMRTFDFTPSLIFFVFILVATFFKYTTSDLQLMKYFITTLNNMSHSTLLYLRVTRNGETKNESKQIPRDGINEKILKITTCT